MDNIVFGVIPDGAELLEILDEYRVEDEIPCGKKSCRQSHKRGYHVAFRCEDGAERVGCIGNQCGALEFGATWGSKRSAYQTRRNIAASQDQHADFLADAEKWAPRLSAVISALRPYLSVREIFQRQAGLLFNLCRDAVRQDHAEIRYRRWSTEAERVHRVLGPRFFTEAISVESLRMKEQAVAGIRKQIETAGKAKEIAERRSNLGNLESIVVGAEQYVRHCEHALAEDHMRSLLVAYEAKTHSSGEFRISGKRFQCYSEDSFDDPAWVVIAYLGKPGGR